jgi:hypothetical protein
MISNFIVEFLQHMLEEISPLFANWIFYSEMTVALAAAFMCTITLYVGHGDREEALFGLVTFLAYAGFCRLQAWRYGDRRRKEERAKDARRFANVAAVSRPADLRHSPHQSPFAENYAVRKTSYEALSVCLTSSSINPRPSIERQSAPITRYSVSTTLTSGSFQRKGGAWASPL